MKTVNIHEAKTHLSALIAAVEAGEEVVIARANKPVVKLVAVEPKPVQRIPGLHKGEFYMADDFDAPLPDEFWLGNGPI
ncbi:MAG: antitoxin [Hydrogenophilales bacterium 16-64-46]|nr:MAG: antitoxin [Hydrogenophilales bacterium 12-64-13]OYZ06527.1 MAG: antitoxin [Hydrogenophilales bacterium 16-64-46]OZA39235.1 MAG: antitoxin [Hydrogenophilales bacterium 17-64-34]HQS98786.1 type II toxin-antitoxin system Phd/YefM family antitoxin [Thiobacillus sp.]